MNLNRFFALVLVVILTNLRYTHIQFDMHDNHQPVALPFVRFVDHTAYTFTEI